jgi:hypothetical protein
MVRISMHALCIVGMWGWAKSNRTTNWDSLLPQHITHHHPVSYTHCHPERPSVTPDPCGVGPEDHGMAPLRVRLWCVQKKSHEVQEAS